MAFWAECVRRRWWCVNQFDAISWYSEFEYNNWWNSLTDEQRERIIANRKRKQKIRSAEVQRGLDIMYSMLSYMADRCERTGRFPYI